MKDRISRRNFLQQSAVTAGFVSMGPMGFSERLYSGEMPSGKLPREVWIACFSQEGLFTTDPDTMVKKVMEYLRELEPYKPDVVCLPERFSFANTNTEGKFSVSERISMSEDVLDKFSDYAKNNNCYVICSVNLPADHSMMYNSAVFLDRHGKRVGAYHKIHPTEGEIDGGIKPGPLFQPVIQTDFGKAGAQICYDVLWDDGWEMFRKQGAEIIFFPSAFPAGQMVNAHAWRHKCVVVASTRKETTKICDITGEELATTGFWNKQLCWAPVNLEKAFLHLYPFVERFPEIRKKYGRKVRITLYHEEEWAIIESLSPEIFVKDILKEFDLKTHEELTAGSETAQNKAREI